MSVLDLERLRRVVEREREGFATASPFPHLIVDDLLDPTAARAVAAEFTQPDDGWTYWHHLNERKRGLADRARMGPGARTVIAALEAPEFVRLVSQLTGVPDLRSDPHLDGGGLHETLPGGFLNVHTDYRSHPIERSWQREVNLLVFLNEEWQPVHRGWLELWDAQVSRCVRRIEPRFNRAVIFRTSDVSFHGVPEGVACPPGNSRKSLALYYFRDTGAALPLAPTRYVPRPADPAIRRMLIHADRLAVYAYSLLKRYTPFGDALVSRFLRRL